MVADDPLENPAIEILDDDESSMFIHAINLLSRSQMSFLGKFYMRNAASRSGA
jgi:hypothetical protein